MSQQHDRLIDILFILLLCVIAVPDAVRGDDGVVLHILLFILHWKGKVFGRIKYNNIRKRTIFDLLRKNKVTLERAIDARQYEYY